MFVSGKNRTAIAGPFVAKLSSVVEGINVVPENIQQLFVADHPRVIGDLHCLKVTLVITAIGGIPELSTGEPGDGVGYTFDILIGSFYTLETATGENRRISLHAAR